MTLKELTIDEINLILVALGKLPLENTLALFTKIKTQAELEVRPVQNIFVNFLVPNSSFIEPPVFFCYNMLPAPQYVY
jgi:hypothetical protein